MTRSNFAAFLVLALLITAPCAKAQRSSAQTPPMGWNSWDSWGYTITGTDFKKSVDYMHGHLQKYGWQYAVIDEGWFAQHPENAALPGKNQDYTISKNGLYLPAPNRFLDGLKDMAAYAHSLGLKFGIHIIHGIPRPSVKTNAPIAGSAFHAQDAANTSDVCSWNSDNYGVKNNAAGQAYYDSMLRLYASWGVDFLKVDCISQPYNMGEIHMIRRAIDKTGRPIVLSLSPGPTPLSEAADVMRNAQMWRISDDVWDVWAKGVSASGFPQSVRNQFALLAAWEKYAGKGHWPDADMLPLGELGPNPGWGARRASRLTHNEARAMFTLWSIARSPLILGTNLLDMDPFTASLVTNPEVIAVNQRSSGNRQVSATANTVVWMARSAEGGRYVAVFNVSDSRRMVNLQWPDLKLKVGKYPVRDLWERKDLGLKPAIDVTLAPHASALFEVTMR